MDKLKLEALNKELLRYSTLDITDIYNEFNTTSVGLTSEEAKKRIKKYGVNSIVDKTKQTWWKHLLSSFMNPFNYVLLVIAIVSFFTDVIFQHPKEKSWSTVIIISAIIILSVLVRFIQEYKSSKEEEALKNLIKISVMVERNGEIIEINSKDVAVGDLVHLAAGDMIPGDARIIYAKDLYVSQSSFTGESEPVEKFATLKEECVGCSASIEKSNICYLGSNVLTGTGKAIILKTGKSSYLGIMSEILMQKKTKTSFEEGVDSVAKLLIKFMVVMVPIVLFVNGFTKGDWIEAFLFSISVAVGLTPEMLPMIVTTNLAKGAVALSKKKVVIKRLDAIENFGAMDVFCTDKTGTLTLDRIVLQKYLNIKNVESDEILKYGFLNSHYQTGLKNLMDQAIIEKGKKRGLTDELANYNKKDEIPFDFSRKRMSIVIEDHQKSREMITKGSLDEMLAICSYYEIDGETLSITPDEISIIKENVKKLGEEGMRVILIAKKSVSNDQAIFEVVDEKEMILMGYMAFLDPPKDSAIDAIKSLKSYGIKVKVFTGDNEVITHKICSDVGIVEKRVITGPMINTMNDDELESVLEKESIFARLTPEHKARLVKTLRKNGHVVGFMGDGINDTTAIKEADVGISVDTAVDVAKETADIVLLEKNLTVLVEGVIEGRKIFGNIIKYIKMTASSNFGNMFSVLVASVFLPFIPMLPVQILTQNFLYDISQTTIPWDNMDKDFFEKPRKWNANDIGKFMIYIGPVSSVFDIITFAVLWYFFKANTIETQGIFQTGWFLESILTQTLIVHAIRTRKIPFIESRATTPVMFMTTMIIFVSMVIPFLHIKKYIGFTAVSGVYYLYLLIIIIAYVSFIQIVKKWYIKKFDSWL